MRKISILTLAVLAAATLSSVALAGTAVPLTDEEMDNVTAAGIIGQVIGQGLNTAASVRNLPTTAVGPQSPPEGKGLGRLTAPGLDPSINTQGGTGNSDFGRSHHQSPLANTQGGPGNSGFGHSHQP